MIRTRTLTSVTLTLTLAVALAACTGSEPTELVSGVSTQMRVPDDIKTFGVVVQRGGQVVFCAGYDVDAEQVVNLPATTAAEPAELLEGRSLETEPVTMTYYGFTERDAFQDCIAAPEPKQVHTGDPDVDAAHAAVPTLRVMRRARTPYAADRVLYLPMALRDACSDVACDVEGEACVGGACTPVDVPTGDLRDFREDFVNARASSCFSTTRCLAGETTASPVDPATCSFTLPLPPDAKTVAGTTNVVVTYDSFSYEVLDADPIEGFIVDDPAKPQSFRLAPNLCNGPYAKGRIISVSGAVGLETPDGQTGCGSKPATQPICAADLDLIKKGKKDKQATLEDPSLCTVPGSTLEAADSALYVLLDRSKSMSQFLNNQTEFQDAIEFTIDNPITKATRIALGFVPAFEAGNTCGSGQIYADPREVEPNFGNPKFDGKQDFAVDGFALAALAQEAISSQLEFDTSQDESNPNLADEGAQLAFDEVMRADGAYAALEKLESARGFNRRAIVVLSNNLPAADCDGSEVNSGERVNTLIKLAEDARDKGLYTYWVPLTNQDERDGQGNPVDENEYQDGESFSDSDERFGAAQQIATAGGTVARNATVPGATGAKEGFEALQGIVNDLGSCVYNLSQNPAVVDALEPADTRLSYVSPSDLERYDIAKNAACNESAQAEAELEPGGATATAISGWNVDGEFVRICGVACSTLRSQLSEASTALGAVKLKSPSVPVLVAKPCP